MINGHTNMGCWQYLPNMGVWQNGSPDPSRRFTGTLSVVQKFEGSAVNEPKYDGGFSNKPKYAGTAAVNE